MRTIKTFRLVFLGLTICLSAYLSKAQTSDTSIRGYVYNPDNEPAMYSTIMLMDKDTVLVKGAFSQEDGSFVFDRIRPGNYYVQIRNIEFKNWLSDMISVGQNEKYLLDRITLQPANYALDEVVVSARKSLVEVHSDKMVVNVSGMTNIGGNALEVLQRSPGVLINRMTKSISVAGKEGVIIMINGKISRMSTDAVVQMLESMNVSNIEKIEIIHTPPANFDAEGNAGIINIVLKQTDDEGLNGGYSMNAGRGAENKYGGGLNFNYRKGLSNFYGSYDHNYNLTPQVFTNYRGVYQGVDFLETATRSDRTHTPTRLQNARLGADFQLSKKTVLGVLGTFFDRNWYMEARNNAIYSRNGGVESNIMMPNSETNHSRSYTGNFNIQHEFSPMHSLNFDADIIRYEIHNPSDYDVREMDASGQFNSRYGLKISKDTPIDVSVMKLDYVLTMTEKITIETGIKYTRMAFNNDVAVDSMPVIGSVQKLAEFSSNSYLNENISGTYVSFSARLDAKTDLKAGLRYEYTNTNLGSLTQADIVDRHYGSWFPSFYITRRFSDTQNLNLSYSRRIARPQLQQLAPYLIFTDPTTMLGGNSALQPAFTNAVALNYGYKSWRVGISYSHIDSPVIFFSGIDPETNRQVDGPRNIINNKVFNANIYLPFKPAAWWEMSNNIYANSIEANMKIDQSDIRIDNISYGFSSTNSFTLPGGYTLELSGNYDSPIYMGVVKWRATAEVNAGIQKSLGDKWGKLRFNASNLFVSNNWYGSTNQPQNNILVDVSYQFGERVFMLTWSNTFGSEKVKAQRSRQTGSSEERQRL